DLRIVRVRFELLAQAAHLHVDRAVEGPGLAAARLLEQEVAREHPARMLRERAQQVELAGGERHVVAFGMGEVAGRRVELPAREAQLAAARRGGGGRGG